MAGHQDEDSALNQFRFKPAAAAVVSAALALALLAAPALADDDDITPRITVSATGTAEIAPDMAIINLTVLREAATAREALDANTAAMAEVLAAMEEEGIAKRDLKTSNFAIRPVIFYPRNSSGQNEEPRITGYRVHNALTVRVRDLDRLGAILDRSVTLGVNQGGGIDFTNDDPGETVKQARVNAMKKAIAKATTLTEAAGVALGRILSISERVDRPRPSPLARAHMKGAGAVAESVPIAAGENTYRVTVKVSFALVQ